MITPGTYIHEFPGLPPSVSEVESAIPAFIGYTENITETIANDLVLAPRRISSLAEYQQRYTVPGGQPCLLFRALQLFFSNGGGTCYIVSIGKSNGPVSKQDFLAGLASLEQMDEPTLLLFPEAAYLPGTDLYAVQRAALKQSATLRDRFCIFDLKHATNALSHSMAVTEFRQEIGADDLAYGAAYTPHVKFRAGTDEIILPPSPAVAAAYVTVDRTRGVWKAPANISLNGVIATEYAISSEEQRSLNVDAESGKSVNAIRAFTGKGILIWGARTLAGNDNEWRYVPVRRFFNMVEESIKKSTEWVVFEPNDANTWVKVQAMIENYLNLKWRAGALAGAKPEHAYYVSVGLNKSMTAQDILEGRLIAEIGMAAIRPAEFILLRFSHLLQQS